MFQSTRPGWGATKVGILTAHRDIVSIHAPARGATPADEHSKSEFSFKSTRPDGARPLRERNEDGDGRFQSTRPARGATEVDGVPVAELTVSIHAPRTGREGPTVPSGSYYWVSIHAPRTGRDFVLQIGDGSPYVSIDAPRTGRDTSIPDTYYMCVFQSTRPARGATVGAVGAERGCHVSIHAPRTGRDADGADVTALGVVSIHAPRTARDAGLCETRRRLNVSIHAPRTGRDGS